MNCDKVYKKFNVSLTTDFIAIWLARKSMVISYAIVFNYYCCHGTKFVANIIKNPFSNFIAAVKFDIACYYIRTENG